MANDDGFFTWEEIRDAVVEDMTGRDHGGSLDSDSGSPKTRYQELIEIALDLLHD